MLFNSCRATSRGVGRATEGALLDIIRSQRVSYSSSQMALFVEKATPFGLDIAIAKESSRGRQAREEDDAKRSKEDGHGVSHLVCVCGDEA